MVHEPHRTTGAWEPQFVRLPDVNAFELAAGVTP
jgi:hypothetical protein